ncbi:MAG: hypothetical protein L6R37_006504 [Teloschistes peruensis]|nr:MAG: hypothetical protein L6R37_006504 [Teloschistes peruensis]
MANNYTHSDEGETIFIPPIHPPPLLDSLKVHRLAETGSLVVDLPSALTDSVNELLTLDRAFFAEKSGFKRKEFPAAEGTELGYYHVADEKEYLTFRHQNTNASKVSQSLSIASARFWSLAAALLHRILCDLSASLNIPLESWDNLLDGCLSMPASRSETTPTLLRLFNYFPGAGSAERHTDTGLLTICIGTAPGLQVWEPSAAPPNGNWIDVGSQATILIGKTLHWLSARRLRAGLHRVVPNDEGRQSIVFALRPSLRHPITDLRPFGEPRTVDMRVIWKEIKGSLFSVNATTKIREAQKERLKARGHIIGEEDDWNNSSEGRGKDAVHGHGPEVGRSGCS